MLGRPWCQRLICRMDGHVLRVSRSHSGALGTCAVLSPSLGSQASPGICLYVYEPRNYCFGQSIYLTI